MRTIKYQFATIIVTAAMAPFAAMAHQADTQFNAALGSAAPASAATRKIVVSPSTKAINVDKGDVVTIEADGKSFTWQFGTLRDGERFELAAIAPAGLAAHGVRVYVAPSPLYTN